MALCFKSLSIAVLLGAFSLVAGCSSQADPLPAPAGPAAGGAPAEGTEGLAKLSDADRAAALQQVICPVTGEKLGSMGPPPKVTVEGQEVFLCCIGCEEKLREDPAKHLAKLKSEPPSQPAK